MKNPLYKLKAFFLSLLVSSPAISAAQEYCIELTHEMSSCCYILPLVEVKTGYFFFSNSKMNKIYDCGGLDVQLATSYPLLNLDNRWVLNGYGSVEYLNRSGKSIHGHQKTVLWSVPVNIGLKPIYEINSCMQYYFTIGPRYFFIQQHNQTSNVYKNKSRNGLGFFVNTGFNYLLCDHFVFDIFGEYSYGKIHFHGKSRVYTRNILIGGFTFGGGFGYTF